MLPLYLCKDIPCAVPEFNRPAVSGSTSFGTPGPSRVPGYSVEHKGFRPSWGNGPSRDSSRATFPPILRKTLGFLSAGRDLCCPVSHRLSGVCRPNRVSVWCRQDDFTAGKEPRHKPRLSDPSPLLYEVSAAALTGTKYKGFLGQLCPARSVYMKVTSVT